MRSFYSLGVSIVEDGGDGITMDLEMNWDGNPSIILDIKTRLGVALPVQVIPDAYCLRSQEPGLIIYAVYVIFLKAFHAL